VDFYETQKAAWNWKVRAWVEGGSSVLVDTLCAFWHTMCSHTNCAAWHASPSANGIAHCTALSSRIAAAELVAPWQQHMHVQGKAW
jgi:hypothetical protein